MATTGIANGTAFSLYVGGTLIAGGTAHSFERSMSTRDTTSKDSAGNKESLEGLGSPMYETGAGPRWNQAPAFQEGYFSGYGMMLPPQNYQMWGSGFMASLPTELGGQMPGRGGGMSGTPME